MLVSDLDGTLLDSKQKISKENQAAIIEFKKSGGKFTIATGRTESSAQPFIKLLGVDLPVILYNGAVIYEPKTGEILMEKFLNEYTELINLFEKVASVVEIGILIYQKGRIYTTEKNSLIYEYEKKDQVNSSLIYKEIYNEPITKILLISPFKKGLERCEEIVKSINYSCELVYSESTYLEILPKGASKGSALKELQNYLQDDSEFQSISVGDNLNDISMLKAATEGFIVENCHTSLLRCGFGHTLHHEENAIADIIYNHIFKDLPKK